jgi:carboxylate-amine ligase
MDARRASVLDHRFGAGPPFTIGIEEEYMLLDPVSLDLVQRADRVLASVRDVELGVALSQELFQSLLEARTPVCASTAEAEPVLRQIRAQVGELSAALGVRFGSAGTHPFSLFERQHITQRDRYSALVDQLQYIARRELIFGLHVHVAVDGADKAVALMRALVGHLPELLALSASSAFWRGAPTGLASSRQSVFAAFPRSGMPPVFRSYEEYAEVIERLQETGCIVDHTHIWWDIRPHPRFGTLEVRVMDAVSRLEDALAIAAYVQALVKRYAEAYDAGAPLPTPDGTLAGENKWLAARYGLDAPLIDLGERNRIRTPVAQIVRRTLRELEPHARELGSDRELEGIRRILLDGNGAEEQRRRFEETRDILEVTREIAERTEAAALVTA